MKNFIFFLLLFILLGCDKSTNSISVRVHNDFSSPIEVIYRYNPSDINIYKKILNTGEIATLRTYSRYNFYNVIDCDYSLAVYVIDSLAVNINGDTSNNLMYGHDELFSCIPASSNSKGLQIWTLEADSSVLK